MPGERPKSHSEESCFRNAILTRVIGVKWPLSAAILVIKKNRKRIVITVNSACVVKRLYTSRYHHQQISWNINVHFNHLNASGWADWMPTVRFTSTTMSYGNPRKGIEQWLYYIEMMITTVWVCCYQIYYYKYFFYYSYVVELLESSIYTLHNWLAPSLSFVVSVHFQGNNSFVSIVKQEGCKVVCSWDLALKLSVKIGKMIPPNASLVKYDNPVLVSRNTDKKSPRVS